MWMKKVGCLLALAATPFYLAACNNLPSSISANNTEPVVYKNSILGFSMAFPPGWKVLMQAPYPIDVVDRMDPQMKSLWEAICPKALFCALSPSSSSAVIIIAMGAKQAPMKPWDAFTTDIKTAVTEMKKHGIPITEMKLVEIDQQPFVHIMNTQEIAHKRYTFDAYYTQYPTFSLDYLAISASPDVVRTSTDIMHSFHQGV